MFVNISLEIKSSYFSDSHYSYKYYNVVNRVIKYKLTVFNSLIPFVFFVAKVITQ